MYPEAVVHEADRFAKSMFAEPPRRPWDVRRLGKVGQRCARGNELGKGLQVIFLVRRNRVQAATRK